MRILLAPMEGVIDHTMRDMLTRIGGIDRCTTEFIRVTHTRLPTKVFHRYCPELLHHGKTPSGVPVFVQLLGGDPEFMAINAAKAAELGAPGIDLNFGCPAKQVNRHDGGSILLREPQRLYDIIGAVRQAVPNPIPVTAKVRLGFADTHQFADIVAAAVAGGATELTVHARTRADGYKPPAHWRELAQAQSCCPIPLVANGEIWSTADYQQCLAASACRDVMLGRGILACPDLARQIQMLQNNAPNISLPWSEIVALLTYFHHLSRDLYDERYVGNRLKQWLGYLRRQYALANELFEQIKRLRCPMAITTTLNRHLELLQTSSV